jgi:hypothetical protein
VVGGTLTFCRLGTEIIGKDDDLSRFRPAVVGDELPRKGVEGSVGDTEERLSGSEVSREGSVSDGLEHRLEEAMLGVEASLVHPPVGAKATA